MRLRLVFVADGQGRHDTRGTIVPSFPWRLLILAVWPPRVPHLTCYTSNLTSDFIPSPVDPRFALRPAHDQSADNMGEEAYYPSRLPRQPVSTRDRYRNTQQYGYDDVEDGDEFEGGGVEFDSFGMYPWVLLALSVH
jgi:hypothetical protein